MRKLLISLVLLLTLVPAVAWADEPAEAQPGTAQVLPPQAEAQLAAEIFDGTAVQPLSTYGYCSSTCARCLRNVSGSCPRDANGAIQYCLSWCL